MYIQWKVQRNKNPDLFPIRYDLLKLQYLDKRSLCYGLYRFIMEITKVNRDNYLPKTIYEMVTCIQMYLESKGHFYKFFEDKEFSDLKYTCDNIIKERAKAGLRSYVKQASVLSFDQEEFLWENGYLGTSNPDQLIHTLIFLLGMHLRAGAEHRALRSVGHNLQFTYFFKNGK